MVHAIVCAIIWLLTILLVPFKRIFQLRSAILISIVWMIFVDNMAAYLGYYSYENNLISIGKASLFQLVGVSGIGILMINWLKEAPMSKLLSILTIAAAFSIVQYVYIQYGAFGYGRLDMVLTYIFNIAALSVFLWVTLAAVERKIYSGEKTRAIMKGPNPV